MAPPRGKQLPDAYCIPGIPYHYQITNYYCGPSALQMIMDYEGEEIDQVTLGDVAATDTWEGTYDDDMLRAAHFSGMSTAYEDPSLQGYPARRLGYACAEYVWWDDPDPYGDLKSLLSGNTPVILTMWWDTDHTATHFRVLNGYDDNLGVFIFQDPWYAPPFWGPNLMIDQAYCVEDLWWAWDWRRRGMIAAPWVLAPSVPAEVAEGDTFVVDLVVRYAGPYPFGGQAPCSSCSATIELPAELGLAGGSTSQSLSNLASGDSAQVSWSVIALGPPGERGIGFQSQGIVQGYTNTYGTYTDSIGGHGYETVVVTARESEGWGEETRLTDAEGSSSTCFPGGRAMVIGNDGTVHVVWADTRDGNSEIYYKSRIAGSWQPDTRLTDDPAFSDSPCIALGEDGSVHVAWMDTRDGNQEIYYKGWDGLSWSADQRVTDFARADINPTIAAGGGGVYVAWERWCYWTTAQMFAVYFSELTETGWTAPVEPDAGAAGGYEAYRPSLAWGVGGLLHLVYERQSSVDEMERIRHRSWDGVSWSARTVLSADVSFSRGPVVATGSDSTVHVVWRDGQNGDGDIFYARFDGVAWQPTEEIVTGGAEATTPSVTVDGSGTVHVAWADHRHGQPEIYLKSNAGSGWTDEVRVSEGQGASMLPTAGANAPGEVCVVWTDLRDGNAEIYFNSNGGSPTEVASRPVPFGAGTPVTLSPPYPMPFASETRLAFSVGRAASLLLEVFDVQGRRVKTLASGFYTPGSYSIAWDGRTADGRNAAPGMYFIRCSTSHGREVRRVVLVR